MSAELHEKGVLKSGKQPLNSTLGSGRSDTLAFDEAPDGGLQAWLVAAGGGCVFFSALGFANSFGVFVEYYLSHQLRDQPPDNVAWIGSLASFLQFATGMIGGPLFDRYGSWVSLLLSNPIDHCLTCA